MAVAQEVRDAWLWMGSHLLTISKLTRWSINYYLDTASSAERATTVLQGAGGGSTTPSVRPGPRCRSAPGTPAPPQGWSGSPTPMKATGMRAGEASYTVPGDGG